MVTIGSLTWVAKVEGAANAQRKAESVGDSMGEAEQKAQSANQSLGGTSDKLGAVSDGASKANNRFGRLNGMTGILTSALFFLISTIGSAIVSFGGLSAIAGTLATWFGALGGYITSFITWVAAGSAGALAFAGALGAAVGLFVVWILHITGIMDKVRALGAMIGNALPAWVRDGLLMLISGWAGALAVIGGFINGFIKGAMQGDLIGGIDQGIAEAQRVLGVFEGAWSRTFGRIKSTVGDALGWVEDKISGVKDTVGDLGSGLVSGLSDTLKGVWNSVIPSTVAFPEVTLPEVTIDAGPLGSETVGGMTVFGGFDFSLPQLQTGGMIEETGALVGHAGEAVLPADVTQNLTQVLGRGGSDGGGGVTIESVDVEIGDQSMDLSNMTRLEMEEFAQIIADELGLEVEQII